MFEPIHGSAPKYTGKGVVNPVASIESIRMMMDHLGETQASQDIETSLSRVLNDGKIKTRDMGGKHATSEMGDAIRDAILVNKGG
jgi:tartrate dehydrogenase/decarboxylase/D-malate dehydrogenase